MQTMYRLLRELWKYLFKNKTKIKDQVAPLLCADLLMTPPPPDCPELDVAHPLFLPADHLA